MLLARMMFVLSTLALGCGGAAQAPSPHDGPPPSSDFEVVLPLGWGASTVLVDDERIYLAGSSGGIFVKSKRGRGAEVLGRDCREQKHGEGGYDHLAMDAKYIYWTAGNSFCRARKTGGSPMEIPAERNPRYFAMDEAFFYWIDDGGILRMAKEGGPVEQFAQKPERGPVETLGMNSTHLYFTVNEVVGERPVMTKRGPSKRKILRGAIMRMAKTGGSPEVVVDATQGIGLFEVNDAGLVWKTEDGEATVLPRGAGLSYPLPDGPSGAQEFAIDDAWIYFATHGAKLYRSPIGRSCRSLLAEGQGSVMDIAFDTEHVYWIRHVVEGGYNDDELRRTRKPADDAPMECFP